ncbi:MAG: PLP-dependent aminotransferase family protein [Rhodoglobus sp.]
MSRVAAPVDLVLDLRDGPEPLRQRLADAIIRSIAAGSLVPGDSLPATRSLARELGVPRGQVVDAYSELSAAGFVNSVGGSNTFVATGADAPARAGVATHVDARPRDVVAPQSSQFPELRWNLRPGFPDTSIIDLSDWRRSWRIAGSQIPRPVSTFAIAHPELRAAVATHLRRTRGVIAEPEEIFLLPGSTSSLTTLALAARLGTRGVAFEEPGYDEARSALTAAGVAVRPVPVDEDGIQAHLLSPNDSAVYLTPAHQFPLGVRTSVQRRAELLEWAESTGGLLIEDDYDGEFRYDSAPIPAMAAIDGARRHVAYIGTLSKVLTPALRVSWLIPPPQLTGAVADLISDSGTSIDVVTGLAMAHFLTSGGLSRHLARAARLYGHRRNRLLSAIQARMPLLSVQGIQAGLHVTIPLPPGGDDAAVVSRAAAHDVSLRSLSDFYQQDPQPGIAIGYATLPELHVDTVADIVARALAPEFGLS